MMAVKSFLDDQFPSNHMTDASINSIHSASEAQGYTVAKSSDVFLFLDPCSDYFQLILSSAVPSFAICPKFHK